MSHCYCRRILGHNNKDLDKDLGPVLDLGKGRQQMNDTGKYTGGLESRFNIAQ